MPDTVDVTRTVFALSPREDEPLAHRRAFRGLTVLATPAGIRRVDFWRRPPAGLAGRKIPPGRFVAIASSGPANAAVERLADELEGYFEGRSRRFSAPLDLPAASSSFAARVWHELLRIPYGRLATYGEIAARVGSPGAARAVGQAVGRNPLPIVVPCHRVVGGGGLLTGFSSGLDIKTRLLALEGVAIAGAAELSRCRALV